MAFDTADIADFDGDIETRDIGPRFTKNDRDTFARVWSTTDDLLHALIGFHLTDTQFVGIRMFLGTFDLGDGKFRQAFGWIAHAFDLKAKIGQSL